MSFGKRPSISSAAPTPQQPQTDPHGRRKVFPDELWEGESGEMLRALGVRPDDESNLVANASSLNAAIERSKAAHERDFSDAQQRVQSTLKSAQIRPFFLIPDSVWNSPSGVFLMTVLELFPYDSWNVMYLAADERTAMTLDLAPHPNCDVPAFVQAAQEFMTNVQADMDRVRAHVERSQNFALFADAQADMREQVKALAALFSRRIAETWATNSPTGSDTQAH